MEFKLPKRFLFWSVWLSFEVSRLQCMGGELKGGGVSNQLWHWARKKLAPSECDKRKLTTINCLWILYGDICPFLALRIFSSAQVRGTRTNGEASGISNGSAAPSVFGRLLQLGHWRPPRQSDSHKNYLFFHLFYNTVRHSLCTKYVYQFKARHR